MSLRAKLKGLYGRLPIANVAGPRRCADIGTISAGSDVDFQRTCESSSHQFQGGEFLDARFRTFFRADEPAKFPEEFIARIPNGRVHGFGTVMTADGSCVISDASISWEYAGEGDHPLVGRRRIRRPVRLRGTTSIAAVRGGWGYYHWLLEELPRIILMERCSYSYDRLISNAARGFQLEALQFLGVDAEIIQPTSESSYVCDCLIAPSFVGRSGYPAASTMSLLGILKERVLERAGAASWPRHLYISRNGSDRRAVSNEPELLATLAPYGFEKLYLEELSLTQQVQLFDSAEVIVAPHGAGLTNLVFCNSNARVIELFNSNYAVSCYFQLSRLKGLQYHALAENCAKALRTHQNFVQAAVSVDCDSLGQKLHCLFQERGDPGRTDEIQKHGIQ